MSTPLTELSKGQRKTLERMRDGWMLIDADRTRIFPPRKGCNETVDPRIFSSAKVRGLIKSVPCRSLGMTKYTITDAGRKALAGKGKT